MFWILRRTGAVNFFNSLNNNCSTSKGGNNSTNDKYVKRPPRKAYGRLSVDSDDAISMKHNKIDDPFDDLDDHFEIIAPHNGGNGNNSATNTLATTTHDCHASGTTDCQGNYVGANVCDMNINGRVCGKTISSSVCGGISKSKSTNGCSSQKELNENTISRLHAMVMSDDEDYDESLTCNVCDRAFHCHRQLASHQQKKRHFGCSGCDSLFPSLMLLEHHKEEFEHWSDDEISRRICCRRNRGDDYFTDTDSFTSEAESEDMERLL